jgi:hypothetical protein
MLKRVVYYTLQREAAIQKIERGDIIEHKMNKLKSTSDILFGAEDSLKIECYLKMDLCGSNIW